MNVRGWLIVGGTRGTMPLDMHVGATSVLPDAAAYPVGSWFYWTAGHYQIVVVCVEIPLAVV